MRFVGRVPLPFAALAGAYAFFIEYLPPLKRVRFYSDIEGYHYPLLNYLFKSLSAGRFPEWDPSVYCGLSFVGNIQASIFYPPTWLLLAANAGRLGIPFKAVEIFVILHLWLAFVLCYRWLRGQNMEPLAALLGAAVFACSGYAATQSNHVGTICGFAWFPLGFAGLDQAARERRFRPLWKLAAASSLAFLAGYPPTWFVFAVLAAVYALSAGGWRLLLAASGALTISLGLTAVQWMPTREAASLVELKDNYGAGVHPRDVPHLYISYALPNYIDQSPASTAPVETMSSCMYLGAPFFFSFVCFARRPWKRAYLPALALGTVSLVMAINAFNLVLPVVDRVPGLGEICRSWNFLAGVPLAAALLTGAALTDFLGRKPRASRPRAAFAWMALMLAWSAFLVYVWLPGGPEFWSGWRSAVLPATMLALTAAGLASVRATFGSRRVAVTAALLAGVLVDLKVFTTSRRFDSLPGDIDRIFDEDARTTVHAMRGLDPENYAGLTAHPTYRILGGPVPTDLRHYGLATPRGFDPMLPAAYRNLVLSLGARFWPDGRNFNLDPTREDILRLFGVRYVITADGDATYQRLKASPLFRHLRPGPYFFQMFEYLRAEPAYRWEGTGPVICERWLPERREFTIHAPEAGALALKEQWYPGWTARVDGHPAAIRRWNQALQSVAVPAGLHHVVFEFRSPGLRTGAAVSAATLLLCAAALGFVFRRSRMPD